MFRLPVILNNHFSPTDPYWFSQHLSHSSSLNEHLCFTLVRPAVQSWYISDNFNYSQWLATNSVEVVLHAGINIHKIIYHAACGGYCTDLFTDNVPYITGSTELSLNRMVVFTAFGGFSHQRYDQKGNSIDWEVQVLVCSLHLYPHPSSAICSPHSAFYTDRFFILNNNEIGDVRYMSNEQNP